MVITEYIKASIIVLGLLLVTLINFNLTVGDFIFPLFPFLGSCLIILYALNPNIKVPLRPIVYSSILFLIFTIHYFSTLYFTDLNMKYTTFLGLIFNLILFIAAYSIIIFDKNLFIKYLKFILQIHVLIFYLLFISANIFNSGISDIGIYLPLIDAARTVNSVEAIFDYRIAGLFTEPGNYATYIFAIWIMYFKDRGRLNSLDIFTLLSIILTNSLFGIIIVSLAILMYIPDIYKFSKLYFILLTAMILSVLKSIYPRLLNLEDGSINQKIGFFNYFLEKDFLNMLRGSGMGIHDCGPCILNDNGTWFYIIYTQGLLLGAFIFLLLFLLISKNNLRSLYLFSILMITKFSFTTAMFWVVLSYYSVKSNKLHEKNNSYNT